MGKYKIIIPVFLCSLLLGCSAPKEPSANKLVTDIQIQCRNGQAVLQRHYSDAQKMEVVLSYLRALHRRQPTDVDPERLEGPQFKIYLTYSDGTERYIFQRSDQFLSVDFGPWQAVEQNTAAFLYPLLQSIPGD